MMNTAMRRIFAATLAVPVVFAGAGTSADALDSAIRIAAEMQVAAAQSQDRIDALAEQTETLLDEYRAVNREIESLRIYNAKLEELIGSQNDEMASLNDQLDRVTGIERQIMPLILRMIDTLERFVELDVPFLLDERRDRIARLRSLMDRADVSVAEKYRLLMEAYQIENEYGRTILAYEGPLQLDGEMRQVNFLRIGRLTLLYQTLDRSQTGVWDQESRAWKSLSSDYRNSVSTGISIARKQAAPNLLRLPVPSPEAL